MAFKFLALFGLLAACSVGPGLLAVRRFRWEAAEKLAAAIGLSFCLVYAATFLIFVMGWAPDSAFFVTTACVALTGLCAGDLRRLARDRLVRRQVAAFAVLLAWGLLLLALVRNYSGGVCSVDWIEHYFRARYFITRPPQSVICGLPLAARPPLMNVVATHLLAQLGLHYELFQVTFLVLNLLFIFPLVLLLRRFDPQTVRGLALLVVLLMADPLVWWNATWTWTKLFTAFHVLLALHFYLTGLETRDRWRTAAAFVFVSAGFLCHYSAGPYALALGLHYAVVVWPRRQGRWREAALAVLPSAALLATWFAFALSKYGLRTAFASNTTARGFGKESARDNVAKVAHNLVNTFVPQPLHLSREVFDRDLDQPSRLGYVRDFALTLYSPNLVLAMGSVGGLLVVGLLARALWGKPAPDPRRGFWLFFVAFSAAVGIAVHPTEDAFGVGHICGQPLVLLGLAYLAANFAQLPAVLRILGLAGCALDFAFGVFLHFHLENRVWEGGPPRRTPLERFEQAPGVPSAVMLSAQGLSKWAGFNWQAKTQARVTFWGDYFARWAGLLEVVTLAAFATALGVGGWAVGEETSTRNGIRRARAARSAAK